jgi:SAM-dependent methyltransferase
MTAVLYNELYSKQKFPIFQNRVYGTAEAAKGCDTGDILLVESLATGLVSNAAFDVARVVYDTSYNNEQANSSYFRSHLDKIATIIETTMGCTDIVEVGCGKGFFLEMLLERGFDITGFDPTYEGNNERVRNEYFIQNLGITGSGIILRHVLEHIPDPFNFLRLLAEANGKRGLIYIEVPCFDWICQHKAWFDIFYEHVNYFRLTDFYRMFERVVVGKHSFGDQYLSVVADLASLRPPKFQNDDRANFPMDFDAAISKPAQIVAPKVIWGGASKGVIYALLRQRAGFPVERVIDINPAKQGYFLPGTGLQICSPANGLAGLPHGTTILVMNPNYLPEVQQIAGSVFNCKGISDV